LSCPRREQEQAQANQKGSPAMKKLIILVAIIGIAAFAFSKLASKEEAQ
jgi:flagellar biogenesis protein FliO